MTIITSRAMRNSNNFWGYLNAVGGRQFHASSSKLAKNRIFTSVRNQDDFSNLLLLSSSSRVPILTLWTASWCPSCRVVSPLIKTLLDEGVGEKEGGVGFAEVELDAPTVGDLAMRFMITSTPTLLSFSRQEPQMDTRITSATNLKDRDFLKQWIVKEAGRGGHGGGGGSGGGLFSLFQR